MAGTPGWEPAAGAAHTTTYSTPCKFREQPSLKQGGTYPEIAAAQWRAARPALPSARPGKSHRKSRLCPGLYSDSAAGPQRRTKQHSSWSDRCRLYRFCGWPDQASGASPARRPDPNRSTVRLLLYFAALLGLNSGLIFSNRSSDLWSYGDSNPDLLHACEQATHPPQYIAAGHRPAACTPVRPDPGRLRYFLAVPRPFHNHCSHRPRHGCPPLSRPRRFSGQHGCRSSGRCSGLP